ncbi:TetR/AcrR family transcriptional regulator [Paenibacillus sabuli]|nr:TetR/AcrR family transcriptional regulator [Paenibacillus sabuli]
MKNIASNGANNGPNRLTKKGKETRARIVAAAAELMFGNGVAGTSVEDVQRKASVSASQLYHYFSEKRALIAAVVAYQTEQVLGAQEPLFGRLDTLEGLQAWRDAIVQLQLERQCQGGCPIGSLASELSETDAAVRAELAEAFGRWEHAIAAGLRAMAARGELRPGANPDRLALALLAALQGGLLLTQVRRDTEALAAGLDVILAHIRAQLA